MIAYQRILLKKISKFIHAEIMRTLEQYSILCRATQFKNIL